MKTAAIIAEYNPLHKGHAWQLAEAKKQTRADYVIIVLSGNFVQRGHPALLDKYARARMALLCGADLVLELPSPYATGSAESFAQGAVSLLESLGCVDALCFGCECGDLSPLLDYARLFEEEPRDYRELLKSFLKDGLSFPAARSRAAEEYLNYTQRILPCSAGDADCRSAFSVLQFPNNILGIEYCRALLRKGSSIRPAALPRRSLDYHDLSLDGEFASASAIRKALLEKGLTPKVQNQLPPASLEILKDYMERSGLLCADDFSQILFYRLLSLPLPDLSKMQDVSPSLAARMENCKFQFTSFTSFADLLKTRQLTHSRITRALCHILLNLRQDMWESLRQAGFPAYPRVLGFRKNAAPLLAAIKEKGDAPLLVKPADALQILTPLQLALFESDCFAAHVYESAKAVRFHTPFLHEYTRSPVLLP